MFEDRWSVVSWPTEYGGRDVGIFEWLVFEEEYYRARAPKRVSQNGIFLLAPTMLEYGTDGPEGALPAAHGRRATRSGARAGPSPTPAATSPASARRAARNAAGDGWVLNGQKTWASRGAFAEWCFGIFRTDPEAERHRGLTYFLVAMDSPGVTVRPIPQIDGETGFAEIFFDNVEVPEDQVLGEVGAGWSVAMATAGSERGLSPAQPGPLHRGSRPPRRSSSTERGGPGRAPPTPWPRPTWTPRPTSCTPTGRPRGWPAATPSGPRPAATRSSGPRPTSPSTPPALDLLGPDAELLEAGAPGDVARRLPLLPRRPDLRRDQRDPAQRGGRAPARAAAGLRARGRRWTSRSATSRRRCARASARCSTRSAPPTRCAPSSWPTRPAGPSWPQNRWAVLAELGAPALVVPEAANGLGLGDVDLVGVLEEAGRACLPEPLLETAALAAPTLPALLPDRTAAAALAALVEDDASFAVGGVDVTVGRGRVPDDGVGGRHAAHAPRRRRTATRPSSCWPAATPTRAGSCTRCPRTRARCTRPRRSARRAICPPCTGRSTRTRCSPTASPRRRRCRCWRTAPPPAARRCSSAWPSACSP